VRQLQSKIKGLPWFFIVFCCSFAHAYPKAHLQYDLKFIQDQVLLYKKLTLDPKIMNPKIFFASEVSLKQFQDAIEPQWGFRPDSITNAYVFANNEIYLLDDDTYYKQNHRCMDDSLAHEWTHFLQLKYQKFDMNDESLEWDAIDLQNWFRENFCNLEN